MVGLHKFADAGLGADSVYKLGHKLRRKAPEKFFFSVPQKICVVPPPNFGGTAGAYHSGKTDIVKITRVKKKQGTVNLANS